MSTKQFILFLLLISIFNLAETQFTQKVMYPFHSNKLQLTSYFISFTPSVSYPTNSQLIISFPLEYNLTQLSSSIQCLMAKPTSINDSAYAPVACSVDPNLQITNYVTVGGLKINTQNLSKIYPTNIVLRNVKNPNAKSSSYFSLCIETSGVISQCDKLYGRVIFTPSSNTYQNGLGIDSQPLPIVGMGNTYTFNFIISPAYLNYVKQSIVLRIVLPSEFSSLKPLCSLISYKSNVMESFKQVNTNILPGSSNMVECSGFTNISQYIGANNSIIMKVENIYNPLKIGPFSGFSIEVLRQNYNEIIEKIQFNSSVTLRTQQLVVTLLQQNMMRLSTNQYFFYINHNIDYHTHSKMVFRFNKFTNTSLTSWKLHSAKIINGFSQSTLNYQVINSSNPSIQIQSYGLAARSKQQILSINLTSPLQIGNYTVSIETYISGQRVGDWTGTVNINSTIGTMQLLSISAVRRPTKLPVNSTGPLQLTFFLNYELPQSDAVPNGTLKVTIVPQIPEPNPDIHGVVKCYFKGTLQAADCTYDNSIANKTIITMVSPPHDSFKYSQIPIIITTEGAIDTDHIGLTIDPSVQRYKFQCEFHLYNSSTIPSELFYTTWVADPVPITTFTAAATTYEANQLTHLQISFIMPLIDVLTASKQFRIMIQFLNAHQGVWHTTLGYSSNSIIKDYPCIVLNLPGTGIKCDLYNFHTNLVPHTNTFLNANLTGPYFLVYGFEDSLTIGTNVIIQLPKIKIGAAVGSPAIIKLVILQETPLEVEPFVALYSQDITVFTILPPITLTTVLLNSTDIYQTQTNYQYNITWDPVRNTEITKIVYEIPDIPSLTTSPLACINPICGTFGLPANWIVESVTSVPTTYTFLTKIDQIRTMDHIPSLKSFFPIKITTYNSVGQTITKYSYNVQYIPKQIAGTFSFAETTVYGGLSQWYSLSFTNSNTTTSSYPFVRYTLSSNMRFSDPPQCISTTFIKYNQSNLVCILQNPQTMVIRNIKSLVGLAYYEVLVKAQTLTSSSLTPLVDIEINHNFTIDKSLVSEANDVSGGTLIPILEKPNKFKISNPQFKNEGARIGYIGPIFINFISSASFTANIVVKFSDHRYNGGGWKTPNSINLDPIVCLNNQIRFQCSPINGPLTITINSVTILTGNNQLKLDSEYIPPFNGIKHPDVPGHYSITLTLLNSTNNTIEAISFLTYIRPPSFLHMRVGSVVKDIGSESVYQINFTVPATHIYPNSYDDAANYSRIYVQFPTKAGILNVFDANLGGYTGTNNERVGCYFTVGTQYVMMNNLTKIMQCRMRNPQHTNDPVRVQVVNHGPFSSIQNSLSLYVFKVFNPSISHSSVPITVKIDHIDALTGYIYPLYQQTYTVFLHPYPKNTNVSVVASIDPSSDQFFQTGTEVGDYGTILINSHITTATPITNPFYMLVKLPSYLTPEDFQKSPTVFKQCGSRFQECVTCPELNYVLVKVKQNVSTFEVYIKNYPISVSQQDLFFDSYIWQEGRHTSIIRYNISGQFRWKELIGPITLNSIGPANLADMLVMGKRQANIKISFTNANYIPRTGSIQIGFPPQITKVYEFCRSSISLGSMLVSQSGASGEIGCSVQAGNKWVITGFEELLPGQTVIISGNIDLPSIPGLISGNGHITTYSDTHSTDIFNNGWIIDTFLGQFPLTINTYEAMNVNPNIFLSQRQVLRQNYVRQFRMTIMPTSSISSTGYIQFRMYKKSIKAQSGGFILTTTKKVCEFMMNTHQHIGCSVKESQDNTVSGHQAIVYELSPVETLNALTFYQVRLTSQTYSQPQGIQYPSVASTYKIDVIQKPSALANKKIEQRYIEVYGKEFTSLKITQYCHLADQYNPIWFQLQPTVQIDIDHQIVIQFPTRSNDGMTRMFSDSLGFSNLNDGSSIPMDIFDSGVLTNSFMKCRVFFGDYTLSAPAKVVCGELQSALVPGQFLRFAITIKNPPRLTPPNIKSQLSLPIIIYSYDSFLFKKINFNLVNAALFVFNGEQITTQNIGYFSTIGNTMQTPNEYFKMASKHTNAIAIGDSYVVRFNFPLRVNGLKSGFCLNAAGAVIGDTYYHQNLRTVICKITTLALAASPTPTAATIQLGNFYTNWYALTDVERLIQAIATYHSTTSSEVITYAEKYPILLPRTIFASPATLTITPVIGHNIACQTDDFIFRLRLEDVGTTFDNVKYTKMISIEFPLFSVVDYWVENSDCIEHPDSQIQVIACQVVLQNPITIFVQILSKNYKNDAYLAIRTNNMAIRNPCQTYSAAALNKFKVHFYSWENGVKSRDTQYIYLKIDATNMRTNYTLPACTLEPVTGKFHYPFDYVSTPYQRYYNEFPQFNSGQYSPISFEMMLPSALSTLSVGIYHKVIIRYGADWTPLATDSMTLDLRYNKPICFIHNTRISRCTINDTLKQLTMEFSFALPTTSVNVYGSVLDPRNPHLNGFKYDGAIGLTKITVEVWGNGNAEPFVFQSLPFVGKQSTVNNVTVPQRGIKSAKIDYANSMTTQLNVLDIQITTNRSDIYGLVFEIPLMDEDGVAIFTNTYVKKSFFDLSDGSEYPCGNNKASDTVSGNRKCFIKHGDNTKLGTSTFITMIDFNYTTTINARILLYNPDVVGAWFSIKIKAFTGTQDQYSPFGRNYIGYWNFNNVFRLVAGSISSFSYTSIPTSYYVYAYKGPWRDLTEWLVTNVVPANQYTIFQVKMSDNSLSPKDDDICEVNFNKGQTSCDDFILLKSKETSLVRGFFIKKQTGVSWRIKYLKCKHYLNVFKAYYHTSKIAKNQFSHTIDNTFLDYTALTHTVNYLTINQFRVFLQIDFTSAISTILSGGFNWQNDVNYNLMLTFTGSWSLYFYLGITNCFISGGFKNTLNQMPLCSIYSNPTMILITNFQQMIFNARMNGYIVKLEFATASGTHPYPSAASLTTISASLYAQGDNTLNLVNQIFTSSGTHTLPSRYSGYTTPTNAYSTSLCSTSTRPYSFTARYGYSRNYMNFVTNFNSFTATTTSISMSFTIVPTSTITITAITSSSGFTVTNELKFLFMLQGMKFSTCAISSASISTNGNAAISIPFVSCISLATGNFGVQFDSAGYSDTTYFPSLGSTFTTTESMTFNIVLSITATQSSIYRQWVSLSSYIQVYNFVRDYYTCGCSLCDYVWWHYIFTGGDDEQVMPQLSLGTLSLGTLSKNINVPTELQIKLINLQISVGTSLTSKILLFQFASTNTQPFTYINDTTIKNHPLDCYCEKSSISTFASPVQITSPICDLRLPQGTFTNFAITIDIPVSLGWSFRCYFPEWQLYTNGLTATGKIINDKGSFPPHFSSMTTYGSRYASLSSSLTFATPVPPNTLLITEDTSLFYATPTTVESKFNTPYNLKITHSALVNQPILYINLQKGGMIPDKKLCPATDFVLCRVYSKYRNIIVAQSISASTSTVTLTKDPANDLLYPKHKEPSLVSTDYDIIAYLADSSGSFIAGGSYGRLSSDLLMSQPSFHVYPEAVTSNDVYSYTSNLVLSFSISPHQLQVYWKKKSSIIIQCSTPSILVTNGGCTALSADNADFTLDCHIQSNKIYVTNEIYSQTPLSGTGFVQVIVGVTNPNTPVNFILKVYEYINNIANNYGQMIQKIATYTPTLLNATLPTSQSSLKVNPFNTKVMSDIHSPFRIIFKLANTQNLLPTGLSGLTDTIDYDKSQYFWLTELESISPHTQFECYFREYSTEPTTNLNTPIVNSFRNFKQGTQNKVFQSVCSYINSTTIKIEAPKKPISFDKYYELVVMITGSTMIQTGFSNVADSKFKFIAVNNPAFSTYSNEYIGPLIPYATNKFNLNSIYIVTNRVQQPTALQLHFGITFTSTVVFPNHYFEFRFQNLNLDAIRPPFNVLGADIPCTFSDIRFLPLVTRTTQPKCIINYFNNLHQTIVVRVVNIGQLYVYNDYVFALDDFLLPALPLLQATSSFSVCLRYYNQFSNINYQKCFRQIFTMDGINMTPVSINTGTFHSLSSTVLGQTLTGKIQLTYPMDSTSLVSQKVMMRITGGYSVTNPSNILVSTYNLLWVNSALHLYIMRQPNGTLNNVTDLSLTNLINPDPYLAIPYQSICTIELTYYDSYQPIADFTVNQPPYTGLYQTPSYVQLGSILNVDVNSNYKVPMNTPVTIQVNLVISVNKTFLQVKKVDLLELKFISGVSSLIKCWVATNNTALKVPYDRDGDCQVISNTLFLRNFHDGNVNYDQRIFIQFKLSSNTLSYNTTLYSENRQIQYRNTYSKTLTIIDTTQSPEQQLSFTENYYTSYLFEQAITPLTLADRARYLYFAMYLPAQLIEATTIFRIYLPSTLFPTNYLTEPNLICQWLTINERDFRTGVYSTCKYVAPDIYVDAPYGGLPYINGSVRYHYLLRIREKDVINSRFTLPTTASSYEVKLELNNSNSFKSDTFIFQPYWHFNSLKMTHNTLTQIDYNSYFVEFTPSATVVPGTQTVLQLSIDSRYIDLDLGLTTLFSLYGRSATNSSIINYLNHSIIYDIIPNKWINGIPFTCYTDTSLSPLRTALHTTTTKVNSNIRITLVLETAYTAGVMYVWKIPLLKNPPANTPFRMNLTLFTYTSAFANKQLFYEIINEHFTSTPSSSALSYSLTATNMIQSLTSDLSIKFNSYTPLIGERVQMKLMDNTVGIIEFTDFMNSIPGTSSDPSYSFFFFPRINLLIAQKIVSDNSTNLLTGMLQKTNQYADYVGYTWVKVHSTTQKPYTKKIGPTVSQILQPCIITTTPTFTIPQGINTLQGSSFLISISITTPCKIPKNSTYLISYDNTHYSSIPETPCYTPLKYAICTNKPNGQLHINFIESVNVNSVILVEFYLQTVGPLNTTTNIISGYLYGIPQVVYTKIVSMPVLATLSVGSVSNKLSKLYTKELVIEPLYEFSQMDIRGIFQPSHLIFNTLQLTYPFSGSLLSTQRLIYRKNYTTYSLDDQLGWTQTYHNATTINTASSLIPSDGSYIHSIAINQSYAFTLESTNEPSALNNFTIGSVSSFYKFLYQTQSEIQYDQVYPIPQAEPVTIINPLTQVAQLTVLGLQFNIVNHTINPTDKLTIQLDSSNLQYEMYHSFNQPIECVEAVMGVLTANPNLVCQMSQYPTSTKPAIITVYPTNVVPVATQIIIILSPIYNPKRIMVAGVTVKLLKDCGGRYPCMVYQGRGYYRTTSSLIINNYGISGTFTPVNNEVLFSGTTHQYLINTDVMMATFIKYPTNYQSIMPLTCTYAGGNCYVFPNQRRVVAVIPGVSTNTIAISGLNNGFYVSPIGQWIQLTAVSPTALHKYSIPHANLTTINHSLTIPTQTLNTFTIMPTQTPNLFIRNYMNTVYITILGLYSNKFIKCFYINAPKDIINWDATYCNATMVSALHNPYPTRLVCGYQNDTTIQIIIPEGVEYQPILSETYQIHLHAKFKIIDFGTNDGILYVNQSVMSGNFQAYGSYSLTKNIYNYYISSVVTAINISEHRTPIIGNVEFNTESFEERLAHINQQTTFQLLFDPLTTQTINIIQVIIPKQFGYPPVGNHNACELITRDITKLGICRQIRKDDQTVIQIQLTQPYDNGPRILKIASTNKTQWFKAPSEPGPWYNLTVSLYGLNGTLLEKQITSNSSSIGGIDLQIPNITLTNALDEKQMQILDISFIVGSSAIRQGHQNNLKYGEGYTQIRISFENLKAFSPSLGTNLSEGASVGCISSLTTLTEITCKLHIGLSINDQPYISIQGYEKIPSYTNVQIKLSNILNLPSTSRNTLSISVILKKKDMNPQVYLYNPTNKIFAATSPLLTNLPTALNIAYSTLQIVTLPTTLTITFTPTTTVTDYIVLKLPNDMININYRTLITSCSLATKIQIFYHSNTVRIWLLAPHMSGQSKVYTINNFPSPKYELKSQNIPIKFQAYSGRKQVNTQLYTIIGLSMFTCLINPQQFSLIFMSSPYTYDSDISYTFQFSTIKLYNELQNTVSIAFPSNYGDLVAMGAKCSTKNGFKCQVNKNGYVDITNFTTTLTSEQVTITGLTNPSTIINTFTIISYSGNNVDQRICSGTTTNKLLETTSNLCSFSLSSTHLTAKAKAQYMFVMTCQQPFRNNSEVYIKIPIQYTFNNNMSSKYPCWSTSSLYASSNNCLIKFVNGSYYLIMSNLYVPNNQIQLVIKAQILNPLVARLFNFNVEVKVNGFTYSYTNNQTITIQNNNFTKMQSLQLTNLPQQAGSQALYMFAIPTTYLNTSLCIDFPPHFTLPTQLSATIFNYNTTITQTSYFQLLKQIAPLPKTEITQSVQFNIQSRLCIGNISAYAKSSNAWTYIVLQHIKNPPYATTQSFSINSYTSDRQLESYYNGPLNYSIQSPPSPIRYVNVTVGDNDVLYQTQYNLTFFLDEDVYTNKTSIMVKFPPNSFIYALKTVKCSLYMDGIMIYTDNCTIVSDKLVFSILTDGIILLKSKYIIINIDKLFNPANTSTCKVFQDYLNSYFHLDIMRNGQIITHQTSAPTNMISKPCLIFRILRSDILLNIPSVVDAGFIYNLTVRITQPTKMLNVILKSTIPQYLQFSPSSIYFNSYEKKEITITMKVNSNSIPITGYINITHLQSGLYDLFRPNLPFFITIRTDRRESVIVSELTQNSVGNYISFPIKLTKPSANDMYLVLKQINSNTQLQIANYTIILKANSTESEILIRYDSTSIPETINISLSLNSQYTLRYDVIPTILYLKFGINPVYKITSIMTITTSYRYSMSPLSGKTVYHINETINPQILPIIIKQQSISVLPTSAIIQIHTMLEANIYYYVLVEGEHLRKQPKSPQSIKSQVNSKMAKTWRNSSKIINPLTQITLSGLSSQTKYYFYAMASDNIGNSKQFITLAFTTPPPSNAVELQLQLSQIITNEVDIVRALSEILEIDILRIKVTSSEKILNSTNKNSLYHNTPKYKFTIVISPSLTNSSTPPIDTLLSKLINSTTGRNRLKQLIPSWTNNIPSAKLPPYIILDRVKPVLDRPPEALNIYYFNATFTIKYWTQAKIYAILLQQRNVAPKSLQVVKKHIKGRRVVESDLAPSSRQIRFGYNRLNEPVRLHVVTKTDISGKASIFVNNIHPGSNYTMYITATSYQPYEPIIFSDNSEVTVLEFSTLWNPSFENQDSMLLQELKMVNPKMYGAISNHLKNQQIKRDKNGQQI